ncbi:succinylglutamate desuccinylase/aspartoacylase family protein [Planctomycetota bacterium]
MGTRRQLDIPVARLPTQTSLSLPVCVVHGATPGPRLWLSAAIHGDEANGIEIIRQVLEKIEAKKLKGTLIAVPIVNVFGFIDRSRYMPDRRDLNRSFPGSKRGSLASRLASLFMREVVSQCTHGIDLHTGTNHRTNLPQLRADLRDRETRRCALAFDAPVFFHARTRDGSLREAATERGIKVLLYEGGEANRFNRRAISTGVKGVLRVMTATGMGTFVRKNVLARRRGVELADSRWVRARRSGILRLTVELASEVEEGEVLGTVSDAFGGKASEATAPCAGVVIARTKAPLVHQGDAIVCLGRRKQQRRKA